MTLRSLLRETSIYSGDCLIVATESADVSCENTFLRTRPGIEAQSQLRD